MKTLLVILGLAVSATPLAAQEFTDEAQKRFYTSFRNLYDVSDFRGVNALVERSQRDAEGVLSILGYRYQHQGKLDIIDEMTPLASALDKKAGATVYSKRLEYLQTLDREGYAVRDEGHVLLQKANQQYDEGRQNKDKASYRRALSTFDEALPKLEQAKDLEWISFCRFRLGHCHELLNEYYEAVVAYDVAMDEWNASGRPKADANYEYMVEKRRELIDKGYDPAKEAPTASSEDGGAGRNTLTSFTEGSEWEEHETSYKKMKKAIEWPTFSPYSCEHLLTWRQFGYRMNSVNDLAYFSKCRPFDAEVKVVRDGAKGLLDIDGDGTGDVEAKIIDLKPTLNEFSKDNNRRGDKYAVWMATGGQNLVWLGHQVNYQELGYYRVGCYREVKINGERLVIFDDNCSGVLGDDPDEQRDGVLRGNPQFRDLDAMVVGKSKVAVPFSDVVRLGETWTRIKLSDTQGKTLKTRAMSLDSGFVKVDWDGPNPPTSLVVGEVRELQGAYFDVAGKKAVEVPVGRYQIAIGKIDKGKKTQAQQVWIFKGKSKAFEVKAGETTTLEMGGAFRFEFETENEGRKFTIKGDSILLYDRFDALIGKMAPSILLPEVTIKTETGSTLSKGKEMRIVTTEEFNKGHFRAYLPQDFEIDKSPSAKCKARLSLKKDKFLGGPFDSEWQ